MATACRIYVDESPLKYIDVFHDGYPSFSGRILLSHYSTKEDLNRLMNLGDLAYLDKDTSAPEGHSFNSPVKGHCVAYGRDRYFCTYGPKFSDSISLIREHTYIFHNDKWFYIEDTEHMMELTEDFILSMQESSPMAC